MIRIKRIFLTIVIIAALVMASYFYYVYTPAPDKPSLAGEWGEHQIDVAQQSRSFAWYRPSSVLANAPLIFILHGSLGSGSGMRTSTAYEFDQLAEQHGFIAVYPDGYKRHWNDCRGTADYAANTENIDDVAFFEAMIDFFIAEERFDRQNSQHNIGEIWLALNGLPH